MPHNSQPHRSEVRVSFTKHTHPNPRSCAQLNMQLVVLASLGLLLAALASAQSVVLPCSKKTGIAGCIECLAANPRRCYLCSHAHLPVHKYGLIASVGDGRGGRGRRPQYRLLGAARGANSARGNFGSTKLPGPPSSGNMLRLTLL